MGKAITPAVQGTDDIARIEAPVTVKAYLICAFAAFGGIFFGYDTGWMSGVLAMPYFINLYTGLEYDWETMSPANGLSPDDYQIPDYLKSLMTSILSAGTFFGALIAGDIADHIGRRPTIIGGCIVFCVGCIMQIASTDQEALMVVGRLVAGLGVGFISAIIILYMSEIAPRKIRGALVSGYQFCITVGILIANCVVYATKDRNDSASYRIPIGIQFLWAIILGVGLFFLPESPRFYVKKGRTGDAQKALAFVRGQDPDSGYIRDELAEIIASHELEAETVPQTSYIGSWTACFKGSIMDGKSNLRRSVLGIGLQMCQQFTGINFIFYFGTTFFQQLGTIENPFMISLITTLVNVCSTPISFFSIERFGRRFLLIYGATLMIIFQFIVAIVGVTKGGLVTDEDGNTSAEFPTATKVMIAFICMNIFSFAISWGPAAWVIVGEVFPLAIRSRGVGLSTASNWFWNCMIGVITPYLVGEENANLGPKVFFLWGSLCIFSLGFAYFLVPEMKGLSLEQVDQMLAETNPRSSAGWSPHVTISSQYHTQHGGEQKNEAEDSMSPEEKV